MMDQLFHLSSEQEEAIQAMHTDEAIFLTGKAGSGKSTVLQAFRQSTTKPTAFLAPTGVAALNIGGSTIHRFFHLPTGTIRPEMIDFLGNELGPILSSVETIVLDEISMIRSDVFCAMDAILKKHAPPALKTHPFGGKQLIAVGDFCQLPPVVADYYDIPLLRQAYGGIYAFETKVWQEANFYNIMLRDMHRQAGDPEYLHFLNGIRGGSWFSGPRISQVIERFNARMNIGSPPLDAITLCTTRNLALSINTAQDACLPGTPFMHHGTASGVFDPDMYPTDLNLQFRTGSRVMMVNNFYLPDGSVQHVNGDIGVITDVDKANSFVKIQLNKGKCISVQPFSWVNWHYKVQQNPDDGSRELAQVPAGSFTQFPFKLAYGVTVHKAQGLTFENRFHVALGERGPFAPGQLYTAMSRGRSGYSVSLDRPLRCSDVKLSPCVQGFNERLEYEIIAQPPLWFEVEFM